MVEAEHHKTKRFNWNKVLNYSLILVAIIFIVIIFMKSSFMSKVVPLEVETQQCKTLCDDNKPCTDDICDETTNFECVYTPKKECYCNDFDSCTTDSYDAVKGRCGHKLITPCCGNTVCDSNEDYSSCSVDCEVSAADCLEWKEENGGNTYAYKVYLPECKKAQLLACRDLYRKGYSGYNTYISSTGEGNAGVCFLNMALNYEDDTICEHISNVEAYDDYWYCMAALRYGESACAHIDDSERYQQCLDLFYK